MLHSAQSMEHLWLAAIKDTPASVHPNFHRHAASLVVAGAQAHDRARQSGRRCLPGPSQRSCNRSSRSGKLGCLSRRRIGLHVAASASQSRNTVRRARDAASHSTRPRRHDRLPGGRPPERHTYSRQCGHPEAENAAHPHRQQLAPGGSDLCDGLPGGAPPGAHPHRRAPVTDAQQAGRTRRLGTRPPGRPTGGAGAARAAQLRRASCTGGQHPAGSGRTFGGCAC